MKKLLKGKCQSCGDVGDLYEYNKSKTCPKCLGMDRAGITRKEILDKNIGKNDRLRRNRKKRW